MKRDLIPRVSSKLLLPFILLFALYVQFHGDYGPGGGFQAGVIFGAGFILYGLIFGLGVLRSILSSDTLRVGFATGVLIYALTGVAGLLLGRNFLDYGVLGPDPVHAREFGILLVEIGVFVTVSGTMTSLFYAFVERGR